MIMNIPDMSLLSQKPKNILAIGLFSSPIGEIFVAWGRGGLKELCVGGRKAEFVARIERKYGAKARFPRPMLSAWVPRRSIATGREKETPFARLFKLLDSYFKGKKVSFDLDIDPEGTEFELKVWHALSRIPYGETRSYGDVAGELGIKGGARAVGGACGKNPLPIIVPCHRVVGALGLGGYSAGGVGTKEILLRLEGAPAPLS